MSPPVRDALVLSLVALAGYVCASRFDLFEDLMRFVQQYEKLQLDEIATILLCLPLLCLVYAFRRLQESKRALKKLQKAENSYRAVFNAAPVGVILFDPKTHQVLDANDQACRDLGYSREEMLKLVVGDFDALVDTTAIKQRGRRHVQRDNVQEFEAQHRTKSGEIRDVLVRVQGVMLGKRDLSFGAHIDITERKKLEASQRLLAREVDHRARNLLAIVQAAIRLAPKHDAAAFARSVEDRVMALARAHSLLARTEWQGADLDQLLKGELSSLLPGDAALPVAVSGPPVVVPPEMTQPMSMVLHELMTNAAKHGALSRPEGRLAVRWRVEDGTLHLIWAETGGPRLNGPPPRRSFGTRMIENTIRNQMHGTMERIWAAEGLTFRLAVPLRARAGAAQAAAPSGEPGDAAQGSPLLPERSDAW